LAIGLAGEVEVEPLNTVGGRGGSGGVAKPGGLFRRKDDNREVKGGKPGIGARPVRSVVQTPPYKGRGPSRTSGPRHKGIGDGFRERGGAEKRGEKHAARPLLIKELPPVSGSRHARRERVERRK